MNAHPLASALLVLLGAYIGVGIVFAVWFAARGAARLDPAVTGSTLGFRFAIMPGAAALWPVLVLRLLRGTGPSRDPHLREPR